MKKRKFKIMNFSFLFFLEKNIYPGEKNSQKRKEKKLVMRSVQGIKNNILKFSIGSQVTHSHKCKNNGLCNNN